jgi:hypothetical protein
MSQEVIPAPPNEPKRWYQSGLFALVLCLVALFSLLIIGMITEGDFSVKPSLLLLKPEGCLLLQQNGLAAQVVETRPDHSCLLSTLYRPPLYKNSGVIVAGDQELRMADDQVVFVGSLESQPWSPKQFRLAIILTAHLLIMLGLVVRIYILAKDIHFIF